MSPSARHKRLHVLFSIVLFHPRGLNLAKFHVTERLGFFTQPCSPCSRSPAPARLAHAVQAVLLTQPCFAHHGAISLTPAESATPPCRRNIK